MNGARGIVVAILYAQKGSPRADGVEAAGTGFPGVSAGASAPRGVDDCPLPNFVVVHFPDYAGRAVWPNLPRT